MALIEDLRILSEQIKKRQAHVKGEEATKQALVLPFLQVLGFDIYDPSEVNPEYVADFAKKKSGGPREKIDYAVNIDGTPAVFLECKAISAKVEDHDGQLARYFNSTPSVKLAVITNGLIYRFFTDLHQPNIMDDAPFFEFRVHGFSDKDVTSLRRFTKSHFKGALVARHAADILLIKKITTEISKLLKAPSDSFVRFIVGEADSMEKIRPADMERYSQLVKESIGLALQDLRDVDASSADIQAPARVESTMNATPIPPVHSEVDGLTEKDSALLEERLNPRATQLEQEILSLINRICAESSLKIPIKHNIRSSCLVVHFGPARSWFVRMYSRGRRTQLTFQLAVSQVEPLAPGFDTSTCPDDFGKSRVYFSSVADVEKLRPVILRAYEDAVRGQTSGHHEEDDAAG